MASATDIITYIGVPLAVLGVLPILYTFILSIFTRRRIRHLLLFHGHKPLSTRRPNDGFAIRSSPMTSLIEVELPRYAIAPLDRNHENYWRTTADELDEKDRHKFTARTHQQNQQQRLLSRAQTSLTMAEEGRVFGYLRGGSWRAFNWKKLLVGRKLYRIQYEDELREPAAEIDLSDLVYFLLDWGAVPDAMGWEKLRANGLWTPSGTVLLRMPEHTITTVTTTGTTGTSATATSLQKGHINWVLRTSVPDESDGILSLSIRWSRDYDADYEDENDKTSSRQVRGAASLPPGWGRLTQPALLEIRDKVGSAADRIDLPTRIQRLKEASKHNLDTQSFRFRAEDNTVSQVRWEQANVETGLISVPFRVLSSPSAAAASTWFTSAAASVLSLKTPPTNLWHFDMPQSILAFARRDSVPCGVMVLLGLLPEDLAPQWSSEVQDSKNSAISMAQRNHQRFVTDLEAQRLEANMPPAQALIARQNRQKQRFRDEQQDMMQRLTEKREREERRVVDAIASARMSSKAVAEACLAWLIEQGEIGREWTVTDLAEAVLYLLVLEFDSSNKNGNTNDNYKNDDYHDHGKKNEDAKTSPNDESKSQARKIVQLLSEWQDWSNAGGMKRQQYALLSELKVEFCFAASLVSVVAGSSSTSAGQAAKDMMECVKSWRKVRLG